MKQTLNKEKRQSITRPNLNMLQRDRYRDPGWNREAEVHLMGHIGGPLCLE